MPIIILKIIDLVLGIKIILIILKIIQIILMRTKQISAK